VSEADLSVLGPLAEHRILIVPQIALILGVTVEAAARRMRRLRTAGLVSYGPVFTGGPGIASITRTGLKVIGRSQPEPSFEPGGYRHDVGVGWLWLAARAGAFGRLDGILTEQAMMAADRAAIRDKSLSGGHVAHGIGLGVFTQHGNPKRHYPDLLLRTHTGHRVAIELELTRKSRHRMTRIMSAYASDARIDRVVYLVPDAALARTVSEAARRAGASQIVQVRRLAPKPVRGADDIGLKRPPRSPAPASARARRGRAPTVSAGSLGTGAER
jgi:hypothetical protein